MSVQPAQNTTIMESVQAEVAPEASQLLQFIVRHTKTIILGFIVFIFAIGAYWMYAKQERTASLERQVEFGQILMQADHKKRLETLEKYIQTAPSSIKMQALFALAESATITQQFDRAAGAWKEIANTDTRTYLLGNIGIAQSLVAQKKYTEALEIYESLISKAQGQYLNNINREIVLLSELSGNYQRAAIACEALLANPTISETDRAAWQQKLATLKQKVE